MIPRMHAYEDTYPRIERSVNYMSTYESVLVTMIVIIVLETKSVTNQLSVMTRNCKHKECIVEYFGLNNKEI